MGKTAHSTMAPPARLAVGAISPRNRKANRIANGTSAAPSRPDSGAGISREPSVHRIDAAANDPPKATSSTASRAETASGSVTNQPNTNKRKADTAPAHTTGVSRKARTMIM